MKRALKGLNAVRAGDCVAGMRRLPDACVDLVFTSPPYADLRDYARGSSPALRRGERIRPDDYVGWFLPAAYEIRRVLKSRGSFVLNINDRCIRGARHLFVFKLVVAMVEIVRMPLIETYVWHKPNPMPGRYGPRPKDAFEYVFWFGKSTDVKFRLAAVGKGLTKMGPGPIYSRGLRGRFGDLEGVRVERRTSGRPMKDAAARARKWADPGNVITCPVARGKSGHPARMPDALAEFFIKLATDSGDVVLDPFLGSGTTARAAERLGRRWLGFEIHPELVDLD